MSRHRILAVDDDPAILRALRRGLSLEGFAVETAADGQAALAGAAGADAIVLDVSMADPSGIEVCRTLRAQGSDVPVLMLSALDEVADRVAGLAAGADDYMAKPFRFEELLARVRLRLRPTAAPPSTARGHVLVYGRLQLDLRTRRMKVDDVEVDLSAREFALAETFMRNPGDVLTRERLLSDVWGYDFDPGSNVVDVYVRYLRRKLGAEHFDTIRGVGYRLVDAPA